MDTPDQAWKKRALAAEAKLAGYRRLRELAEKAMASEVSGEAFDFRDLAGELLMLDVADKSPEFFDQKIGSIEIRTVVGLGAMSTMEGTDGDGVLIKLDAGTSTAGRAIGLLYQLAQYVDIAAAQEGSTEPQVSAAWLMVRIPSLLVLLLSAGLLHPLFPVSPEDVVAAAQ
jgi:hypothetical protein